ncbi:N-acyl-L-amino acid amidohydrolase [Lentibacillus sp. JNUCC-1]|uniref:M20 metallopeptidase family protein n=1 Tax=Lentibacillus sp. JNUCC-1 TaxID=2654513 RepID=UPI0013272768|nr:M20 family metallopeptidase [Lentibacillus sp. JNUCC-1]MUV38823.1 N-acyl-L-amino acid amidohydrolase [Lentibacillus sp. JNUCC-1]
MKEEMINLAQRKKITKQAEELKADLVSWRRRFHKYPELSFEEHETASFVADQLNQIDGMKVQTEVAGTTGVLGTLTSGEGPTIAVRADMDALPITEQSKKDYASQNEGVMHACGHDAHTAILLGVAHVLGEKIQQKAIKGTVKLLFQPAEENPDHKGNTGSKYVVSEGVFQDADAAFALHMCPWLEAGEAQLNAGYSMANNTMFKGTITGSGGHGAYPQQSQDPLWMSGPVMQALYGIVARRVSPLKAGVVTVGKFHSGSSTNVIPEKAEIEGTIRSYDPQVQTFLTDKVKQAFSVADSLGGQADVDITHGEPPLDNHPDVIDWLKQTIQENYPDFSIHEGPYGLGSEDFSYVTQEMPAAMFFLGCKIAGDKERDLHTSDFDIDEACLPYGVSILVETALRYLDGTYNLNTGEK